jgi:hypothetical protein
MNLTKEFWQDAKERAIRTFFQTLLATLPIQVAADKVIAGDWQNLKVLGYQALTAAVAAALSVLMSTYFAKKPNTISPASNVPIPGEFIEVNDPVIIGQYLDSLDELEVDESLLPDEHTTAVEGT